MTSDNKLRNWELALLIALCITFLTGLYAKREQEALSEKIIRLHVIAESDEAEDQQLKLAVRDSVLTAAQPLLEQAGDCRSAESILRENLPALEAAAAAAVQENGGQCQVAAMLGPESYPTREYEGFALPAGRYMSLRVVLGEGEGQNWWCVVYPALCLSAATEEITNVDGLTKSDVALITEADEGYILKFKALELWGRLFAGSRS